MTPETYDKVYEVFQWVFFAELILLAFVIAADVLLRIMVLINNPPEVFYFLQKCDNLTLYKEGCQVRT